MANVSDHIAATVTLNAGGAINDLTRLSAGAQATGASFKESGAHAATAGSTIASSAAKAEAATVSHVAAAEKQAGAMGRVKASFSEASSSVSLFGAGTLKLAGVGGAAFVLRDITEAASKLEQATIQTERTFGDAAGTIESYAQKEAGAIGLSASAAEAAASKFGALFKAVGFGVAPAAEMSTTLVRLAGDLSAFKNIPIEDALNAVTSGLAGKPKALKALGIDLRESRIEATALALGLAGTKEAITETDKTAARYVELLQQTGDAQGAAARTADTYAGAQRRFSAALENTKADLGSKLLTPAAAVVDTIGLIAQGIGAVAESATKGAGPLKDYWEQVKAVNAAGEGSEDVLKAAAKAYTDAESAYKNQTGTLDGVTQAQSRLRAEVDAANVTAREQRTAIEGTSEALSEVTNRMASADSEVEKYVHAQRAAEDATTAVRDAQQGLADAQEKLSELEKKGAVDAEKLAAAEDRLDGAANTLADARERVTVEERKLSELRAKGAVDAKKVEETERSLGEASRSLTSARKAEADAEEALAKLRAGPTKDEATGAARDIVKAQLNVEEAQKRQVDAQNALNASRGGDTVAASYAAREADLAYADAVDNLRHAQEAQDKLNARGVEGSKAITEAEAKVEDAKQSVADGLIRLSLAEQANRDARAGDPEYAQKIATLEHDVDVALRGVDVATRGVQKAQDELRKTQAGDPKFADDLARAHNAVADAQVRVKRAAEDLPVAQERARIATQQFGDILRITSQEGDDLAGAVHRLAPQLDGLANSYYHLAGGIKATADAGGGGGGGGGNGHGLAYNLLNAASGNTIDAIAGLFGRAGGGDVAAGQSYVVGERGPEVLTMGRSSGTITPNGGGARSTSSASTSTETIHTHVHLDGREIAAVVTEHQRSRSRQGGDVFAGR